MEMIQFFVCGINPTLHIVDGWIQLNLKGTVEYSE